MQLSVLRLDLKRFDDLDEIAAHWRELQTRSGDDPLFMSWDWMHRWWRHHREQFDAVLVAFIALDQSGRPRGIALFTSRVARHRGGLRGRRFELCGNFWREADSVMSERIGFLLDREHEREAAAALWTTIQTQQDWDDLVLAHVDSRSATLSTCTARASSCPSYVRQTDTLDAYAVMLEGGLDRYLAALRYSARRKMFANRRRLPQAAWQVCHRAEAVLPGVLQAHDRLHAARWGFPAFAGRRGALYLELAQECAAQGTLALHSLAMENSYIATSFNVRAGDREYVLQSAFDESRSEGYAPGHLLAGYVIEHACAGGLAAVDFLGGGGRKSDYKRAYAASHSSLQTIQLVRSQPLRSLYSMYDRWRRSGAAEATP